MSNDATRCPHCGGDPTIATDGDTLDTQGCICTARPPAVQLAPPRLRLKPRDERVASYSLKPSINQAISRRWAIFCDINEERRRQDERFGVCDHPMAPDVSRARSAHASTACSLLCLPDEDRARAASQYAFSKGYGTFGHIVVEETSEFVSACVLDGELSDHAREEAVQNAAVWVAIIESIDRRRAAKDGAP